MQFKLLATLLSSTALASAEALPTVTSGSASAWSESSETNPDSNSMAIPQIPHSILTALETAIPASWYSEILQPKLRSSIESEIMAGTMPAWYKALPASVLAWASSEGNFINNFIGAEPTSAPVGATSSNAPATGVPAQSTASTMSTAAATTAAGASGSGASGNGPSGTKKSAPSSSTSTGGAPIATGGVAASIAGAAGILGLALAL